MGREAVDDQAAPLTGAVVAGIVGREHNGRIGRAHRHDFATARDQQVGEGAGLTKHFNPCLDRQSRSLYRTAVIQRAVAVGFQLAVAVANRNPASHEVIHTGRERHVARDRRWQFTQPLTDFRCTFRASRGCFAARITARITAAGITTTGAAAAVIRGCFNIDRGTVIPGASTQQGQHEYNKKCFLDFINHGFATSQER